MKRNKSIVIPSKKSLTIDQSSIESLFVEKLHLNLWIVNCGDFVSRQLVVHYALLL